MSRRPTPPVRRRPAGAGGTSSRQDADVRSASPAAPVRTGRPRPARAARSARPARSAPPDRTTSRAATPTAGGRSSGHGPLVPGSAARFAARARAARRLSWRPVLLALAAAALVAVAGWAVLASPLLAVREVGVVGNDRVPRAEVVALVEPAVGTPLARVDTGALEEDVAGLPLVKEVDVVRAWPRTLEVRLVERVPVAAVPADDGFALVDLEAVVVAHQDDAPPDLPVLDVDVSGDPDASGRALAAAIEVVTALPAELAADVASVGAVSRDDVRLTMRDGAAVVWGSADDNALKAQVLQALRGQPAEVYDVSAPLVPVTRAAD
ncbi:cell division protein FtsQ/DivIB [Quadrisphaera sp. GCM10027208]|uniref:cell division protein FtsQ/DivIB n=1 Tax=Quadrisphaera sp. GCM10027208 TaxID=3273423 RepID=UPI0036177CFE